MKWIKENIRFVLLVGGEMLSLFVTALSMARDLKDIPLGSIKIQPVLIGFLIFSTLVAAHIISLHLKLRPRLEVLFGQAEPYVKSEASGWTFYHFMVHNRSGGQTIKNLKAKAHIGRTKDLPYPPARLHQTHGESFCNLDAEDIAFFDFLAMNRSRSIFYIYFSNPDVRMNLPLRDTVFNVLVTGEDCPSLDVKFRLFSRNGEWLVERVNNKPERARLSSI